jgi:acetyltransferase-like isoleucine patch superfamily enzyme
MNHLLNNMNVSSSRIEFDLRGAFFKLYDNLVLHILRFVSTSIMRFVCAIRGIKVGSRTIFYGKTYFRRCIKSSIVIGNSCRLRSSFISNNVGLNRPCFISTLRSNANIIIGNNVGMSGTVIGCAELIKIGDNVLVGGNTFITDFDWHSPNDRSNLAKSRPVIIEDDVFIGLNAIILKGSHIEKGSVIGANSVVSGHIPAGVIAAGNPCKIISQL